VEFASGQDNFEQIPVKLNSFLQKFWVSVFILKEQN